MDPRQMVGLRKQLQAALTPSAPAGSGEGPESAEEMTVECPECGCTFDPSAIADSPAGKDAPAPVPAEEIPA